jgi:hypothetical protein
MCESTNVYCSKCAQETWHKIVFSLDRTKEEQSENGNFDYIDRQYQIIECNGCENVSFRETMCSDLIIDTLGIQETLYPNREFHLPMDNFNLLPPKVKHIYHEIVKSINSKAFILSAIGLRTLIEAVCIDRKVEYEKLYQGISALVKSGYLSKNQADYLHDQRFMGNDAAHLAEAPKEKAIIGAFSIAETILKTIYVLPKIRESYQSKAE